MPAFLTHWRILIETARRSQDAGNDLGSLIVDTSALRRRLSDLPAPPQTTPAGAVWHTGPLPDINYAFPGSDISAMAYLGALAPDIPTFQRNRFKNRRNDKLIQRRAIPITSLKQKEWALLFHTNRSGDLVLAFLEQIADIPSPAIRSQALAFCLGYLSHLAADIALNPWINVVANNQVPTSIANLLFPTGRHFYAELCLDEYMATTYFKHSTHAWLNQPWGHYIEPVTQNILTATGLSERVLDLLVSAIEVTYNLSEEESQQFRHDYLASMQRLRLYLAGRGTFRWLTLYTQLLRFATPPALTTMLATSQNTSVVSLEETIEYAVCLSERLCRRAISYYASLRNTNATAEERNSRRTALQHDLRNWDLYTGYTLEVSFDQEITLRYLHNWIHFSDLWQSETLLSTQKTPAE
jgi:hypothetical protein